MVTVRFTAAITHEGEWFVARALEVEVTSQGHSIDEALANLREALELLIEGPAISLAARHTKARRAGYSA